MNTRERREVIEQAASVPVVAVRPSGELLVLDLELLAAARRRVGLESNQALAAAAGASRASIDSLNERVPGPLLRRSIAAALGLGEGDLWRRRS